MILLRLKNEGALPTFSENFNRGGKMDNILKSIGHITTPYKTIKECPFNIDLNGPLCKLVLNEEYQDGLLGLETGQKILILYWLKNTERNITRQGSSNDKGVMGTFALRSPHRPNPIAAAVLTIESIDSGSISVKGIDCLNGTKLLDIKPAIKDELSD